LSFPDDPDKLKNDLAIAEAALAAWRAFLDLRLEQKFEALTLFEQRLEMELALYELAQVERVN
jgi:hypothetical protein